MVEDEGSPPIGHNLPPFEKLKDRERELSDGAARWVTDHPFNVNLRDMDKVQDEINKLSDFKVQLTDFWKEVDAERKREKKPHDDAAQAVQDKYNPVLTAIKTRGEAVVARLGQWMTHLGGLRDAARRLEDERLRRQKEEADQAKRAAEELARQAEAGELKGSGVDVFAAQEKAEALQAAAKAQEKAVKDLSGTVKGGTGTVGGKKKSVAMRAYHSGVVENYRIVSNYFLAEKNQRLLDVLQALVDEACRRDPENPPPGVKTKTEMRPA